MKHNLSERTKGVITTLRQKRLFMATILLIGMISLGAAWSGIASARGLDFSQSVSGFFQVNDLEECLDITFIGMTDNGDGTTNWVYSVEGQPCDQEVESWMIEIPTCSLVASASPAPYDVVFPDPDLSKDVVKWDLSPDFVSGVFSVTLAGDLVEGQATAGLSDSTAGAESLIIEGPQCDPTLAVSTVIGTDNLTATATITEESTLTEVPFETATETPEDSGLQAETSIPLATETPSNTPVTTETDDGTSTPAASATPTGTLAGTATPLLTQTPTVTGTPSAAQLPAVFLDANLLTLHYVAESNHTMTVNCDNGVVIVSGESNEINIAGQCGMLVLQGDRNQLNVDSSVLISNSGNENVVSVLGPVLLSSTEEPTSSPTPGTGTPTGTPTGIPSGTPGSTATPTPGSTSTPTLPVGSTPTPGATSTESVVPSPTEAVTPTEP